MKRSYLFLAGMMALSALPAGAESQAPDLTFFAVMNQSQEWTSTGAANMKYAVYSLTPGQENYFSRLSSVGTAKMADAGVYVDGKYYTQVVPINSTYFNYTTTFSVFDTDTWKSKVVNSFGTNSTCVAYDMTMDYISGRVYAVGTDTYMGSERQLKTVDLSTGEMTRVGALGAQIFAVAADGLGQLWGVGTPLGISVPVSLYRIDKNTGAATVATKLDVNLYTASSASLTFDLRTGRLYLAGATYTENEHYERTWLYGLFELDTTTGHAELVQTFEWSEVLAGLSLKDCHPQAPQAVTDLSFAFNSGSTTQGHVECTLPVLAYDGSRLSGTLRVEVMVDGTPAHSIEGLTPGSSFVSPAMNLSRGSSHAVKLYCYSGTRKSLPADISVFAGTDTPAAPEALEVSVSESGDAIHISWDDAKSVNGGFIAADRLLYDVTLMPDQKVIASDLKATEMDYQFSERSMNIAQIRVAAKIDGAKSEDAISDIFVAGTPWPVPYLETFNYTSDIYWPLTAIDANHDELSDFGLRWYLDPQNKAAWYYATPTLAHWNADDWIITPTVALDTDKVYSLQFDTYGYMGGVNTLEVTLGSQPVPEKMTHVITRREYDTHGLSAMQPLNIETYFVPQAGDARIGFHNVSNNSDHMFLDNIYLTYYGPLTIPGEVTDFKAEGVKRGVKLTFNAPTLSAGGDRLQALTEVKIYRSTIDSDPIATIASPTPGQAIEFTDEVTGAGVHTYYAVAANAYGRGLVASVTIDTKADVPRAVASFTVTPRNGWTDALLEWTYPASMTGVNGGALAESDITYDIYRTLDNVTTQVAEGVSGNSFFDNTCQAAMPEGKRQVYVSYRIQPRTNGGEGASTRSDNILMGLSYPLPFRESWSRQRQQNFTWTSTGCSSGSSWVINSDVAFDPRAVCQDADYGQLSFSGARTGSSIGEYISPRIDVSTFANPTLTFYLYRSSDTNTQGSVLRIGFITDNGKPEVLSTEYPVYGSETGWEQYTVVIPEKFAKSSRLGIVLHGYTGGYKGQIHIDNLEVTGQLPEKEVKAERIIGGERCLIGQRNTYDVEVANIGTAAVGAMSVEFYADDALVGTEQLSELAAGETALVPFVITPGLDNVERPMQLRAVLQCAEDGSADNNVVESTVALYAPMLPYVTEISAVSAPDASSTIITWEEATRYPHAETVTDDFDSYTPFAITGFGQWTTVDVDGQVTARIGLGSGVLEWEHAGEPQAFIVFNPALCGAGAVIKPRSGSQCLVSFANRTTNDDWLISPQLSGDAQTISFYAKCAYTTDLNERFEVWASTTTPDLDEFVRVSGDAPVIVSSYNQWTRYSYSLPEGAKFFAIHCVSSMQTGLMIDDVVYSPMHEPLDLWGFNVYRDGQKITPSEVGDYSYVDRDVVNGATYTYAVSAVYETGESICSPLAEVTIHEHSGLAETAADATIDIHAAPGAISITAPRGLPLSVTGVDGRLLYSLTSAGHHLLPVTPGIYVVKASTTIAKLLIK